jgi:hypothetical protein
MCTISNSMKNIKHPLIHLVLENNYMYNIIFEKNIHILNVNFRCHNNVKDTNIAPNPAGYSEDMKCLSSPYPH